MAKSWRDRYADGRNGICDFGLNYDFYFKWLLNKVISCFTLKNIPDTFNEPYIKTHLILDGNICVTDFNEKLYGVIGGLGGQPDEYYIPTVYTVANPILGSKTVQLGKDGVLVSNTAIDSLCINSFSGGLYDLIHQTATLLADNIISINCVQINGRVQTFFTADSDAKAVAGEAVLKKMYAGSPFQVLRQDIVEKLQVNPVSTSANGQLLTQLVELHNYIVANFFQSIGIKANNIMKKERLITDEINTQDNFVKLSVLEILASWQKGFDDVNKLYGTDIQVELNPAILDEILDIVEVDSEPSSVDSESVSETPIQDAEESLESDTEQSEQSESISEEEIEETEEESPVEYIEAQEAVVEAIIDVINDTTEEEGESNDQSETG